MTTFSEFGLSSELLQAIEQIGFQTPTQIQQKAIPFLLENHRDFIGLAQTGTGKTAAFGLPIIQKIHREKIPQALILSPTRELCLQIAKDLELFCKYKKNVAIVTVYGGAKIDPQINKIKKGVQIVVATPGRMNDIIRRKKVDLTNIKTVVLDEADEMLNMGFKEELDAILQHTPTTKNILLFSATMPKQVIQIAETYIHDPYEVTVGKKNTGAETVDHAYYVVRGQDRYEALKRIADIHPDIYGIIFCRTRAETKLIAEKLIKDGYNADALHGDLSQEQREFVMGKFRKKNLQMLVATDVVARGLDVENLTHIISYNLPDDLETYTHRSGRTGRAGKKGVSIAIVSRREIEKIKRIERSIHKQFERRQVPNGHEICERQFFHLIERVKNVEVNEEQIAPFMNKVYEKLEAFTPEEVIKHFVALEFNMLLDYYKNERDLNVPYRSKDQNKNKQRSKNKEKHSTKFQRLFINVGRKNNVRPQDIISLVNDISGKRRIPIGEIDISKSFSFFEVPPHEAHELTSTTVYLDDKEVQIRKADSKESKDSGHRFKPNHTVGKKSKKQKRKRKK
ncbi:DEAD/DEAH box helicase [Candidatus Uabimicrobium amorphum]|uniref:RNA helicase n=1 Tax=Uabimicrobium amorphum TaxID=2596890 RepID=A0A5S9II02_UABAM|nr:DEAD/DEAH box helicase [Candidatus Uabimicrobium amorphum]BBM82014.1 DEAD/DEAH box helicase [Candidatus Uabimicrobium amorphum]